MGIIPSPIHMHKIHFWGTGLYNGVDIEIGISFGDITKLTSYHLNFDVTILIRNDRPPESRLFKYSSLA
jgi:hypothetical protein